MNLMPEWETISLGTLSDESRTRAALTLEPMMGTTENDEQFYNELKAGRITGEEIQVDGQPEYVFYYSVHGDTLECNAAAFVGRGQPRTQAGIAGLEMLARSKNCRAVIFVTKRRGLVALMERAGYAIHGLTLKKFL